MNTLLQEKITKSISYEAYRLMIDGLLAENRTTGDNHSPQMLEYTSLNVRRMSRLDKTFRLSDNWKETLEQLNTSYIWLVITEAWCGDAAQIVPILNAIASQTDRIEMRLILRDENPELMDAYLTDGSKSIPKLICINADTLEEVGVWGPRPKVAHELVMAFKAAKEQTYFEFQKDLHLWYARDKAVSIQSELLEEMQRWQGQLRLSEQE